MSKPPRHKPQPAFAQFKQPPRSPRHGANRRTSPPVHSDPAGEPSASAGGSDPADALIYSILGTPGTATYQRARQNTRVDPGLAKFAQMMHAQFMRNLIYGPSPTSPHDLPNEGIRHGEITAFRAWYVLQDATLCSLINTDYEWKPGAIETGDVEQDVSDGYSPHPIYGGIYAFRSFAALKDNTSNRQKESLPKRLRSPIENNSSFQSFEKSLDYIRVKVAIALAFGTVKLWGKMVEHELGYRAEFAKIDSILSIANAERRRDDTPLFNNLCARYNRRGYGNE